jgi:hypothetical protein
VRKLLAILVVVVVSACGAGEPEGPPAADGGSSAPQRLEPLDAPDRPAPADPEGYARSTVRGLWRVADVESDDQTIIVVVANGGCLYFSHMTVDAITDSSIDLEAWNDSWHPVKENYGCTSDLRYVRSKIRLPEPLRGRALEGQCTPGDATIAERQCPDDFFLSGATTRSP